MSSVWSVARDTVARELFGTLAHFAPQRRGADGKIVRRPAWEDLNNETREAWAQVADRSAALARGEHGANKESPDGDDFATFGEHVGSKTIDDFGTDADRTIAVRVDRKHRGPKFAIVARTVETDAGGSKAVEVVIVPVDSRGRFDFNGIEPIAEFVAAVPRVVSLYDLLDGDDGGAFFLADTLVDLNVGDEVAATVTTQVDGGATCVDDTDARTFLTGETS